MLTRLNIQHVSIDLMGKLICMTQQTIFIILSYQETWKRETGNRKRAGSIQQQFCFHWTAKCEIVKT